jgi:UDP-GlcNAc:undecaprenyl-phosphate/decaprenyl-phosphate GlcNAc-1-phosphate transferase
MNVLTEPAAWMSAAVAFGATLLLTPLVIRLAHRMDWLAHPKADRWHTRPTALMGGIAIFAGAIAAALLVAHDLLPWPIVLGAAIMFVTGLVDDLHDIRPVAKLVAQIAATGLLVYNGYVFGVHWPFWISVPLTFLWIVGVTNALNLLDNMDGLAAGIAAIAALVLAVYCGMIGDLASAAMGLAVFGAAAGFLVFNFKPAKIFMGDSGSLFLGYTIAALAVVIQRDVTPAYAFGSYLVSAAVLAVPIFDTTLVTVMRKGSGRAISQGGRDHSSHRLVFLGLSEREAVLTLYGVSLLFGGTALLFLSMSVLLFYALLAIMVVGLVVLGVHLARADVYGSVAAEEITLLARVQTLLRALLGRQWKAIFGLGVDAALVGAAFVVAYHLRFESGITAEREALLVRALPIVIVAKILVFYAFGLYRGIWRHAGTPEILRIAKATVLASLVAFLTLGLVEGFGGLSRGAFVIDWMTTLLAIIAVRFGFRGLRQTISARRRSSRRVLLYGAGEAGQLALRELRQNIGLEMTAVGFVDDDPLKAGLTTQGVRVIGGMRELISLRDGSFDEVLITSARMTDERRREILSICEQFGIPCREFRLSFDVIDFDAVGGDSSDRLVAV